MESRTQNLILFHLIIFALTALAIYLIRMIKRKFNFASSKQSQSISTQNLPKVNSIFEDLKSSYAKAHSLLLNEMESFAIEKEKNDKNPSYGPKKCKEIDDYLSGPTANTKPTSEILQAWTNLVSSVDQDLASENELNKKLISEMEKVNNSKRNAITKALQDITEYKKSYPITNESSINAFIFNYKEKLLNDIDEANKKAKEISGLEENNKNEQIENNVRRNKIKFEDMDDNLLLEAQNIKHHYDESMEKEKEGYGNLIKLLNKLKTSKEERKQNYTQI